MLESEVVNSFVKHSYQLYIPYIKISKGRIFFSERENTNMYYIHIYFIYVCVNACVYVHICMSLCMCVCVLMDIYVCINDYGFYF